MPVPKRPYHHGQLPTALLGAVDELVREQGVVAVSLRAAARRAGVSHAAPAHHFGDKAGLLTAYAAQGFAALRDELERARAEPGDEPELLRAGLAYVRFAVAEPGRFAVMFRPEELHSDDPAYRAERDATFGVLLAAVQQLRSDVEADDPELRQAATGAWAIVHGFSTLWLDGNLAADITTIDPREAAAAALTAFGATLFAAAGVEPGI